MKVFWAALFALLSCTLSAAESLLPPQWDPALAGDRVLLRLVRVTAPQVKGAHDAEFVCVGERAFVVEHDNDVAPGHGAGASQYCVLTIVNLKTLAVEKALPFARSEQKFENVTLPVGMCFVPRIIQRDEHTLRCYFASQPAQADAVTWYRDFDLRTQTFEGAIHKAKLKTAAGVFDMEPRHFHADAKAKGFAKPPVNHGLYIFDSFKVFEGRRYVAINNFPGKQNALAVLHDDFATFEIIGHYNEPQAEQLSESAVNRLPDGSWLAICRNDKGNYHFTSSKDGTQWSVGRELPVVKNGLNSKPVFERIGNTYYLGWRENTRIGNCNRSVFNIEISRDGQTWQRKYRFETPHSFQYPTLHEHNGVAWLSVTQSDHGGSSDRIMFGKLEAVGEFESQQGQQRIVWTPPPPTPAVLTRGVKLFTDRDYVLDEVPEPLKGLPFLRTSIEAQQVEVMKSGPLYALTPSVRPSAAAQHEALLKAGFQKVDVPETQLFPGEINRVSLFRKEAQRGERFSFKKLVLLAMPDAGAVRLADESAALAVVDARTERPVVIVNPGKEFQDDARPGAMIIGMDRTPKGRIWGCWTGTGDKKDGYFLLATSDDGGVKWSKPRLAVGAPDPSGKRQRGALVGNLWTDPLGRLWLFFDQTVIGVTGPTANWFMRCDNPDAESPVWNEPVQFALGCTLNKPTVLSGGSRTRQSSDAGKKDSEPKVAAGKDRNLTISATKTSPSSEGDGDWLLPVSHWAEKTARVYASTDEGKTWTERGNVKFPDWEFDEHMMIELRDGRLWMLARTKGNPHECFSSDKGRTWTEPKPARIQNVNARFFLRRLASGRLLLVKNGPTNQRLDKRSHMSAFLSDDDGETWKGGLVLDERSAVSYPDGFEASGGLIHILYDWNRHTDAEILLAKFREADILAGKVVSKDAKLQLLANKATGPKPHLYNGIELPAEWPPRRLDPASTEPMPVPYLKSVPRLIPIDVGRQLFVDDFLIEKTTLKRTFHKPQKLASNPVFKAETPRELGASDEGERGQEATTFIGQGGLFWDPSEKHFKLFYVAGWRGPLSLATSTDLRHWTRPDLGQGRGNVLLPQGLKWSGNDLKTGGSDNCVWLDLNAKSPSEKVKFLTCWSHVAKDDRPNGFSHSLHVSDGRTFSPAVTSDVPVDDYCSFFFNPFRNKWCFSIKRGTQRGRSRYYMESDEFLSGNKWSQSVFWSAADRLDEPEPAGRYPGAGDRPQLYSLNAVAYESLMVGMHYIHRGPKNEICDAGQFPKLVDLEVGFSRDGFHWDRPDRSGFISGSRVEGSWDRGYCHSTAGVFVVLDEQLVFPYMGTSGIAPSGKRGMYTGGAIGLATLRRDGFSSMDATNEKGSLTTRPVTFSGKELFVNVAAPQGELVVEVIDLPEERVLATSKPIAVDSTKHRIEWDKKADLSSLSGKRVRFRFHLRNGQLYSFWVSPDSSGCSNGYLGAGGPGYGGVRDAAR